LLVVLEPGNNSLGDVADVGRLLDIVGGELSQFLELLYQGRDDEIDDSANDDKDKQQGDNDAQDTSGDMQTELDELDDRILQIGEEPGYDKGQEDSAEVVDEQQDSDCQQTAQHPAYKAVEGNCSFNHFLLE
jgi:hypothetical protein